MKIVLIFLIATGSLFACNSRSSKNKTTNDSATPNNKEHPEQMTGVLLNNGAKWKADSTTLLNVASLQNIVSMAKKETLEDYHQTATRLQDGLNKMVAECKMKGPEHEALHHWLEPLMEKTKGLKNAGSIEDAGIILDEIKNQMNLFSKYFEI